MTRPASSPRGSIIPHPHDILLAKLDRGEAKDWEHATLILEEFPLDLRTLDALAAAMPNRTGTVTSEERRKRFELNGARLRAQLSASNPQRPPSGNSGDAPA